MKIKVLSFFFLLLASSIATHAQDGPKNEPEKAAPADTVPVPADTIPVVPEAEKLLHFDYAKPAEYVIGGITVSGTKFLDQNVLINLSGLVIGDSIDVPGEKISSAIRNLWKQGLFADARIVVTKITGNQIFLEIQLSERPRLSKFSFKGVSKSEADKIREKIGLERDKVITDNLKTSTSNAVKKFYEDKGYLDAEVKLVEFKDTVFANKNILEIQVDKKLLYRIYDIDFEGNKNISDLTLRKSMKDTKQKKWYKIFTGGKFMEDEYEGDKQKIIALYNDKGFRDAYIVSDSVVRTSAQALAIRIRIEEGPRYYFRNITWVGNSKHTSLELSGVLNIKKGDVYNQSVLEERLFMSQSGHDITSIYMDDGYLFFSVTPVEINVENDSIDLEMRIYEGKQATINKVTVSGNTKTNDRVIMREIRTKPGQLFSRNDIIRTQRELAQLGYFDPEKLGVNPKPNPTDGTVDIDYVVEEKPSDQLELSGGYGGNTLYGTLGVSFNNFSARNFFKKGAWRPLPSGDGQRLSLRIQSTGRQYQSYNASFTEPWLGGKKPNSLSVSAYYTLSRGGDPNAPEQQQSLLKVIGTSVGLGKRLYKPDDFFSLFNQINYEHYILRNYPIIPGFSNGTSNNLSFSTTLARNSVDGPIYPRMGSNVSFTLQFTPPYSLFKDKNHTYLTAQEKYKYIEYHKWKFSASWFTKIVGDLVMNAKLQYGFLGYYNKNIGYSPFERFYLGGDGMAGFAYDGREIVGLRGYENQTLPAPPAPGTGNIGGTVFDKYTLELRYPISLNPSATIYVLGFAEAGNSWLSFKEFNPFIAYRAAGAGVRIFLPMFGMLGLDWGYGFDEIPNYPGANDNRFQFTIGQQF